MATFTSTSSRFSALANVFGVSGRTLGGLTALTALLTLAAPAWALTATQRLDLKVLVLSADGTEPEFAAWTAALEREGVPYDAMIASTAAPIEASTLAESATHGRYQAVILATGGLYQCDAVACTSALAPEEWTALNAYQTQFGVRRVTAYAYPTPDYGLNYPFFAADLAGTEASLTADGKAAFPYLAGALPLDVGTWGYYAEPLASATSVPFRTLVAGPVGPGGSAASLVGVYSRPDGFEELVVTAAMNPYQLHALLLSHGLVQWATKGVHLGYARNYFTMHIDDVFLPDDRWDMTDNVTYEDDGVKNPLIRMVAADVDRALAWQAKTNLQLDLVFNGGGSDDVVAAGTKTTTVNGQTVTTKGADPLLTRFLAVKAQFNWINHTYSHPNLDTLTTAEIYAQIHDNFKWSNSKKIATDKNELVTGEHSGLANPGMPAALAQANIQWVAADNSRQPTPYAIGTATTVPRFPSNVYYNVGTFAEQLDEYNYIYFEHCVNTATTTCLTAPATWAQYIDSEASIMLRHLLQNDPKPHYFHQSNLAEDGTFYPVVDEVLARFAKYMRVPLVQPTFTDSGNIMRRAAAWKATMPSASAYYLNGMVYITSPSAVAMPVTGTGAGTVYGGERSAWVNLTAGAVKSFRALNTL